MRHVHQQRQKAAIERLMEQNYERLKSDILGTFKALDEVEGVSMTVNERGQILVERGEVA